MTWREGMTVREALDEKRQQLKGKVASLVYCKRELFYQLKDGQKMGNSADDSVYPVSRQTVAEEAAFFGVEWFEA